MEIDTHGQLESKAGLLPDTLVTQGEMMRAFEQFKETNDQRIAEKKRGGDVLLEEKVARLNDVVQTHQRQFEDMTLKSARPSLSSERSVQTHSAREHKAAFETYVRAGESSGLRSLETKALSVGSAPDGGYLVPAETETEIGRRLTLISPIRSIAGVREISGNVYKKPFMTSGPSAGWAGETADRTQTTSPTLAELSFPAMELYAMPAASATLLEDSARQHRRVDRGGSRAGVRRAGRHRVRVRRRQQQAEGFPQLHDHRRGLLGLDQDWLCGDRHRRWVRR